MRQNRRLRQLYHLVSAYGINLRQLASAIVSTPRFLSSLRTYRQSAHDDRFGAHLSNLNPILHEFNSEAGVASGHYFFQDIWAARKIYSARPERHLDIGSRIDGFIAHVLIFMPVTLIDIRPLKSNVEGLSFLQSDATTLEGIEDNSVESISILHAVEHFGLGRYGDPIAGDAYFHVMRSLARVLQPGGRLYFSTPVGKERLEFNAHRVFAPQTILEIFHDLQLVSFAAIDDEDRFLPVATPVQFGNAQFSCGLFEFTKS